MISDERRESDKKPVRKILPFTVLPDDVVLLIFSKVPISSVIRKTSRVCRRWHRMSIKFLSTYPVRSLDLSFLWSGLRDARLVRIAKRYSESLTSLSTRCVWGRMLAFGFLLCVFAAWLRLLSFTIVRVVVLRSRVSLFLRHPLCFRSLSS